VNQGPKMKKRGETAKEKMQKVWCKMRMACNVMGSDKKCKCNAKTFLHYHPWSSYPDLKSPSGETNNTKFCVLGFGNFNCSGAFLLL
jgi:hypothetical protein